MTANQVIRSHGDETHAPRRAGIRAICVILGIGGLEQMSIFPSAAGSEEYLTLATTIDQVVSLHAAAYHIPSLIVCLKDDRCALEDVKHFSTAPLAVSGMLRLFHREEEDGDGFFER